MRLDGDGGGQLAVAEDLHPARGRDHAGLAQDLGIHRGLAERGQPVQVHDAVFLAENIGKPALRQAAVQGHLATLESAHHARTAARTLALVPARRSLAHAGAHAPAHALFVLRGLARRSNVRKIHKSAFANSLPLFLPAVPARRESRKAESYCTISTRCGTFATMPRIAGVSGRSIT